MKGVKQLGFRLSLFRVAQAQAEPNMNIIDSLLKSKCFLSRRGAENPSPEPFVGRHHKVYPGVGADIVMESLHSLTRIGQFLNECDRLFYKRDVKNILLPPPEAQFWCAASSPLSDRSELESCVLPYGLGFCFAPSQQLHVY